MNSFQPTIQAESIIVVSENQVAADLTSGIVGELIVLELGGGVYYELNEVAAFVWRAIQKPASVESILRRVRDTYEVSESESEQDLMNLLSELLERRLIEVRDA